MNKLSVFTLSLLFGTSSFASSTIEVQDSELLSRLNFMLPALKVTNKPDGRIAVRLDEAILVYPDGADYRMNLASEIQKVFEFDFSRMVSLKIYFEKEDCRALAEDPQIFTCDIPTGQTRDVVGALINFQGKEEMLSDITLQASRAYVNVSKITETNSFGIQEYKKAYTHLYMRTGEKQISVSPSTKAPLEQRQFRF